MPYFITINTNRLMKSNFRRNDRTNIYIKFSNSNDKIDIVDLTERDYEQFLSLTTQIKAAYIVAKEKRDNNDKQDIS